MNFANEFFICFCFVLHVFSFVLLNIFYLLKFSCSVEIIHVLFSWPWLVSLWKLFWISCQVNHITISLGFLEIYLAALLETSLTNSFSLTPCSGVCALDKTDAFPSLYWLALYKRHQFVQRFWRPLSTLFLPKERQEIVVLVCSLSAEVGEEQSYVIYLFKLLSLFSSRWLDCTGCVRASRWARQKHERWGGLLVGELNVWTNHFLPLGETES